MADTSITRSTGRPMVRSTPPYHTGKVQIGLTYVPRQRLDHDQDALRLQDALLVDLQREQELQRELETETRLAALSAVGLAVVIVLMSAGVL